MKDDRVSHDLTKKIKDLENSINGYQDYIKVLRQEIFDLKKYKSEVIILQNLLDGCKKIIVDLSKKNVR